MYSRTIYVHRIFPRRFCVRPFCVHTIFPLLVFVILIGGIGIFCGPHSAWALQAELVKDGVGRVTQATIETQHYKLIVEGGRGARIMSLIDKKAGVELAQKDNGLGGLFEDRPLFSASEYECQATTQTDEKLVLRCAVSRDNVRLIKTYTFTEGQPFFHVCYEIENASQLPFKLWIRNFANPGGGPLTEADRLFLRHEGQLRELTFPDGYFKKLEAPWAAYLDTEKQIGYFVRCDFALLDGFYFWSQSRLTPTFEWIYKPVPPGQKTSAELIFGLVSGVSRIGDIAADGHVSATEKTAPEPRGEPRFVALPNWKPLEELYQPTDEEKQRGFMAIVSGVPQPAPRLKAIQIDMGLQEAEAVPIEIFGLAEKAHIQAKITGLGAKLQIEENGWLLDPTAEQAPTVTVERGQSRRLWLKWPVQRRRPGLTRGQIALTSGQGTPLVLPVQLTVWRAQLPEEPIIGTQYYAFLPTLSSYDLEDAAKRKFLVYLDNLQALHCDNVDWAVVVSLAVPHLKIAGTGESLKEWGAKHPHTPVAQLPELDFSYYDIWLKEPVKRGMRRFVAHVPAQNGWREAALIEAALGQKPADPNDEISWKVMEWFYRQLRQYAARQGFTSFWAKIDDEIPPEHIPLWLEGARHYRAAGYKPFTTNTGNIPRSESLLKEMNKESDAWQVALCLVRDFLELTRRGAVFETQRDVITSRWLPYTNGGAENTYATRVFGETRPGADKIDNVQIYADGHALRMKGGSGWGNKERGVAMQYGDYVYICLPDGGDPNRAHIEVSYRVRTIKEGGAPAVPLEPTDEIWYYGGGSYKSSYEASRAYPWRVVAWNMRGYGYWTYLWWNDEDILVRYRPETNDLRISAAWEGLRDGNEDAAYFRLAEEKLKKTGRKEAWQHLRRVFGTDEKAVLRMGEIRREIYAWDDFLDPTYAAYNAAKREALRVLSQ